MALHQPSKGLVDGAGIREGRMRKVKEQTSGPDAGERVCVSAFRTVRGVEIGYMNGDFV